MSVPYLVTTVYQGDCDKIRTKNRDFKNICEYLKICEILRIKKFRTLIHLIAVTVFGSVDFLKINPRY